MTWENSAITIATLLPIAGGLVLLGAVRVGRIRLIDNLLVAGR